VTYKNRFKNKPLLAIFFTVFMDLIGFGILMPIIPILLVDTQSSFYVLPASFTIAQGYILLGFLLAVFPICQFFTAPILGQMSDKFGRKKLLIIALAGACLSFIIFAFGVLTKSLPIMFFSRMLSGLTGGSISIAMAAIADITKPENRAKGFGLIGLAFGLGSIIGPFIGGKFSDPSIVSWFNSSTPFWFAAILSLVNVLMVAYLLPETHLNKRLDLKINWNKALNNIFNVYGLRGFRAVFGTLFLFDIGFTFYATFLSVFLLNRFGFHQGEIADFFAYTGIWIIITQTVIINKISSLFKDYQVIRITPLIMGLCLLLYTFATAPWQLFLIAPFFIISMGLTRAFINSLISRSAGPEVQGEVLGTSSSISFLGQSIPPILSGFIAASIAPQAPLYTASVMIISAGLAFILLYKAPRKQVIIK
jgi:DHA1 family tetracycline resistance protein-like MFS transporter